MSRAFWLDVLRHGLQVLVFCCLIAVFTTLIWPQAGYGAQLVYSVSIGLLIWTVIEFGRLLVPAEHCHRDPSRPGHGWPKGWRGVLLTVAGIGLGYLGGQWKEEPGPPAAQRDQRQAGVDAHINQGVHIPAHLGAGTLARQALAGGLVVRRMGGP